jgi:hypothetical protein
MSGERVGREGGGEGGALVAGAGLGGELERKKVEEEVVVEEEEEESLLALLLLSQAAVVGERREGEVAPDNVSKRKEGGREGERMR